MTLQVKNKADGKVYPIHKYILSSDGIESVWCNDWYGHHRIGFDCEWATHHRAKVLVDALEGLLQWHTQPNKIPAEGLDRRVEAARNALEQWEGKEPVKDEPKPQPNLGTCKECKTRPAVKDYNGHGHYVCQLCDNSLNREFDEEYR